jgi:hypothetical protein
MKATVHNNIEIKITLTKASKEYLFYLNDILHGLAEHCAAVFDFSVQRPTEKDILNIDVRVFGCTNEFRLKLYNVLNILFKDDSNIFNYETVKSDSYVYDPEKIEEKNLKQCDKIFEVEKK